MTDEKPDAKNYELGKEWMQRLEAQKNIEKNWIDGALEAQKAYSADDEDGKAPDFNILHSNVETIVPATYNSTPSPDIRARHNSNDRGTKLVADIYERAISTQIDDERLDSEIEATALDAFLTGRGVTRIKYDAQMQDQILQGERVLYENVAWKDYREGPAQRWGDVPWVAYRYHVSQEAMDKKYGNTPDTDPSKATDDATDDKKGGVNLWQIWDKESREVITVAEDNCRVVSIQPDPLGLRGFFPQPEPVQPLRINGSRTPICPYQVYKTLARELNTQTKRINLITKGLKVRGFHAADTDAMETLADAPDNSLVAVPDLRSIAPDGNLDRAIAWWPVDKAIVVLRELMQQREQTKQAIYEITGISDIVRGASNTKETATAQQIKTQWGSLRIKRLQNMIARHVRDLFILTAEVMEKQFAPESILRAAGIEVQPEELAQLAPMLHQVDHYRIDVESDSTVRADLTQKRGEMAEYLQGTAQFFQVMAPLVQQQPEIAGPVVEMYAAFARQFSLGKQAEDALDQMVEMAKQVQPGQSQQSQPDPIKVKETEIKAQKVAQDGEKQRFDAQLAARGQKMDEIKAVHEIEIERAQQRPVAIGLG